MPANESPLAVGYVLKRYPRFSETFVVNEILALEAAGVSVEIFALGPVAETHFQEAISRVKAPVRRIRHQFHDTELYWQLLARAHDELPGFRKHLALATQHDWVTVGQGIVLAMKAREAGLRHLHAHFGTQAATVARLAAAFADINYSFTAHAKDIYHRYDEPVHLDAKIRDAAFTVTVSDYNLKHLREQHGARQDNSHRIYNGLDLSAFPFHAPAAPPPHVVAVGRLVEKKGFPLLVEAMGILRDRGVDCHCTLVGDGPLRGVLKARIAELKLQDRVHLTGVQTQPQVIRLLREAAMLAAPCIISEGGDRDGLPTILVEAMALGVPCISTQVVGIPELVRDQDTGLCIPPNSPEALADAIAELLQDPQKAARLARHARALIEDDYDVHQNTQRLRALFRQSIDAVDGRHAEGQQAHAAMPAPGAVSTHAHATPSNGTLHS
ncbi:MAG: glycosyltransferase family 4 protein [Lautropia sp.]|nr:glycosyltransferase family 4 protein [Lautropia sp.]